MFAYSSDGVILKNERDNNLSYNTKIHWKVPCIFLDLLKTNEVFIRNQSLKIFDEVVAPSRTHKKLTILEWNVIL